MKIFPDHISPGDPIFNKSQIYSKTNEKFIYKLGYYTNSTDTIYSQKYGIYYEPVSCFSGGSYSNSGTTYFSSNIIKDKESTKETNYFEEVELFEKVMTGFNIECPSHLKIVHNKNLKITYIIPVVPLSAGSKFTLHIIHPNLDHIDPNYYIEICNVDLQSDKVTIVKIDIKTIVDNVLGSDVKMEFKCIDSIKNIQIQAKTTTGQEDFQFVFNKDSSNGIALSNFRITVEDVSVTTGIETNKILIRSKNGLGSPNSCRNENSDEECFRGYTCMVSKCEKCHYSCAKCNNADLSNSCTKCGPLTIKEVPEYGQCPINFIDLTQFKDFDIKILPKGDEFNERATIGLWLFFADLTESRSLQNDIYHIALENRIVISIVPFDNKLTAYCHAFEDLYKKVTSDTKLYSTYYDQNSEYVVSQVISAESEDIKTMNGKWFHVSCGISFDDSKFYIKHVINGNNKFVENTLPKEKLYPDSGVPNNGINDVFYRHILNKGEHLTLSIKNFGNSNAKIYAKHLIFFKEYISPDIQYVYFDFVDSTDFPEILFQLPLDQLYPGSKIKGYQYDSGNKEEKEITLLLSHPERIEYNAPINFYRLLLNKPNKKYKRIDLKDLDTEDLTQTTPSNGLYFYDDNKIINCKNNYFYKDKDCISNTTKCGPDFITNPGVSQTTGYCDKSCSGSQTCNQNLNSREDYDPESNPGYCKPNSVTYNLFFNCVPYTSNYYMQFSGFYNSQTIKINLANSLQSYIIEFWFYPDFFLQANARKTQFTYPDPSNTKYFFFHSNVMDCYFVQTDRLVPYFYDSKSVKKVESIYNSNEWNKFVIYGKHLKETDDYIKTVYVNHAFDQPITFSVSKASPSTSLLNITFCEVKCQDINSENIHWTTGYYRDLRIWDGNLASYSEVVQYNDFYPNDIFTQTISSILCYFPLKNQYISNNKILDLDSSKTFCSVLIEPGDYHLQKYNYGTKFDIIYGNGLEGKYCQHKSDPAFIDTCDTGCKRCWERTFCYECSNDYFLSGRKCIAKNMEFFRSPSRSGGNVVLSYTGDSGNIDDGITLSFWTKPIGFLDSKIQLILVIGASNALSLYYSSIDDDPVYGLFLYGNAVTSSPKPKPEGLIGYDSEFRDNIGKWTYISIAYHKQKKTGDVIFFPRMMKFEINTDSIPVNIENSINADPDFSQISINSGYYGLFYQIHLYDHFIVQSMTLEKNLNIFYPLNTPADQDLLANYKNTHVNDYVPDEKPDYGLFLETCPLYQDTLKTEGSCINACSGEGWERCTCSARNQNSQMLFKNNNKILCRPLDYINFAKIKKIQIDNLRSATNPYPRKCTLQFWMYAYAYNPGSFGGIEVIWDKHNKIEFRDCDGNFKCKFRCMEYPNTNNKLEIEDLKINQWIFLSCAIDYQFTGNIYIDYNTQDNEGKYDWRKLVDDKEISGPSSLTIEDKTVYDDWGVLFFRQIRLWKNAFFNAKFLSRILIETPSKFPDLLHSWEPTYNGKMIADYQNANFKVKDITGTSDPFVIGYRDGTKRESRYGMNVIDETKYSILTMCSEDGLYFDIALQKCMQFLDLSKMNDFNFTDLPSAYSGNFAMSFWVFFEDVGQYKDFGLHIRWSRHAQITIKKLVTDTKEELRGYCLPQGYYSDQEENDPDFLNKYDNALNKADVRLLPENSPEEGVWIWVTCSVSYYGRNFYIKGNNEMKEKEIESEIIIKKTDGSDDVKASYPMRFYLSDLNNNNMYKSKLSIINIDHENMGKKLYFREILLFRNYIPEWYSEKIKYMNLRDLKDNELPALAFVANFADFDLETKKLKYIIFERPYGGTNYEKVDTSLLLTVRNPGSTFELSANFDFQSLCDLNADSPTKYDVNETLCVRINNCIIQDLRATYCMDEDMPLACQAGSLLTIIKTNDTNEEKFRCESTCSIEEFITPGTPKERAICNTQCGDLVKAANDGNCPTTVTIMPCGNDYYRIGYKCINKSDDEKSALFFSKCYNSPNFYRTISTNTLNKINSGYFYEFWMKLDNTLIQEKTCKEAGKSSKEYYLYSTPHSIYLDTEVDIFYYQIINSAYKKEVNKINRYKWNKIVIETKIETTGQNVYIHINFEKDPVELLNVDTSILLRLQYISFCSRKTSGDCIPGSSNIMWGSAYYRNIRVWDIKSSSIQTILDYNSALYDKISKSLVLFYPLTISNMDNNILKESITGEDSIVVKHLRSNNFQSDDDVINYNYETKLDWELTHECTDEEEVLVKDDCKKVTGYYLKVPNPNTAVKFNISSINIPDNPLRTFTFCIYIKFIGVLKDATSAQPIIFSFKDDTFLVYDIATSYAIFYIGGYEKEAFRDTRFHDYIGIWTPICIANLISENTFIHPNMFTLSINKIDIPFTSGFQIPKDGVPFSHIEIGEEIIAFFSEFRIYNRFIQGNFGTIAASEGVRNNIDELIIHYPLKCDKTSLCEVDAQFADTSIIPCCVKDYNIYDDDSKQTRNDNDYFDTNLENGETTAHCDEYCKTLCYNSKSNECTCKMTDTVYWLRKNKATLKTYCEHPPFIDYSLLDPVDIIVPSSNTNESSLEFWFYIYSYNTTNINFKEINIIWDKHNRVQIINDKNSLSAKCYALCDVSDPNKFTDLVQSISVTAFGWTSIRCGTSINLPTFKHFFNTYEKIINPAIEILPYDRCNHTSNLIIKNNELTPKSYGFFFIRELKLWQQYNLNYIDTSYINLASYSFYNKVLKRSDGEFPGLITLIRSEYDIKKYGDAIDGRYYVTNLMIPEDETDYPRESKLRRGNNYIGYNLIDPSNSDYYKTLLLCDEDWVYNSLFNYCEKPSYTKCKSPGDTKDTCMLCPETAKYIDPIDGLCKSECPTGYYPRDDMNQCRPCEATCYKCSWLFEFNCTECIGARYLVKSEHRCVEKCEEYNLTASNITNNLCTGFDSMANLTNHKIYPDEIIDINTFDKLQGIITNYSSRDYTVLWGFEKELTREANNDPSMTFSPESPFIGDLTKEEEVLLNKSFFKYATDYIFSITVIAHNVLYYDSIVNNTHLFHLRTNSYPENGTLNISPKVGLYRTTYFVIKCEGWQDDTSPNNKLQYRFFAQEEFTNNIVLLRNWSLESEMSSNFSVMYYQQEQSRIKITCEIKDELEANTSISDYITIAKSLSGGIYSLEEAINTYQEIPEEDKSYEKYDVLLYHRSQFLLSLVSDPYKTVYPTLLQTQYEPTLQGDVILMEDPKCVNEYCNGNGDCTLVDEFIICRCKEGWIGKYCQIDVSVEYNLKNLTNRYEELINETLRSAQPPISWYQFMTFYNLFKGAALFYNDTENRNFFTIYFETFLSHAMQTFQESIANNTIEYLDILDSYYSYEIMRMEKRKASLQVGSERKINFTKPEDIKEFGNSFNYLNGNLTNFMKFLANENSVTRRTITYESENYYLAVIPLNPSFDDQTFFKERKKKYKTYVDFMSCLNYVEIDKLSNQYYQGYLVYIEYNYFPFSYNATLMENNVSPLIELNLLDSTTGKFIAISGCNGQNRIIIHMPFYSFRFLDELNSQKPLYDPHIYKSPDDPIFSDPVYIEENGFISDDTIEQRIEKYSRRYNISPNYYDENAYDFSLKGVDYINFTGDTNFIEFSSTHLCRFSNFIIKNNATYHPNGRFYYLLRPRIIKYLPNFINSLGSLVLIVAFCIYLFLTIIFLCYDSRLQEKEILLNSIKEEIIKNFYPYAKNIEAIYKKLVPTQMNIKDFKPEIKFGPEANTNIITNTKKNLITSTQGEDGEKTEKLTLRTNVVKDENEKNGGMNIKGRKKVDKIRKTIRNNFMDGKKEIKEIEEKKVDEDKKSDEGIEGEIDKEIGNVDIATFNINYLSKEEEKTKEEKDRRVESYANLRLDACTFFRKNYVIRNPLINSIGNVSLFQPRWKKMTMLFTEITIMELIIAILLTNDSKARIDLDITSIKFLFAYGLAACCISNFIMYNLAIFFQFPYDSARRLFKLVLFNGQLIVMREWGEISSTQKIKSFFGLIICIILWIASLYISLGFTAVWKEQKLDFLISLIFGIVLNFFILELIVEGIIAIIYKGRKKYKCIKHFGFLLNRLRNYRCLA